MKKILFGGSFDPIHLGHINMAELASKQLDADVIFLPSKISVWKKDSIDIKHKINMINLAIEGHKGFFIDLYEVNSGLDTNYSIDTVKYFKNKYPNDELYYLIGTDHVNAFHKWKDALELSKIAHIIYFSRPNLVLDENNIKTYQMIEIKGSMIDVSSTDIRAFKSFKVDEKIKEYIFDNNLYFIPKIKSYLKEKRFNHSKSVGDLALKIALKHNIKDPDRAFIAGMLHDIGKETEQDKIMKEHYKEYLDLPRFAYHQFVGELISKEDFHIEDKEILEAIKFHATGKDNMSTLAKIIYASDKIEPTRGFDSKDLIEAMMLDIDEGFITVLKANRDFLKANRGDIENRLTYNCFKYYL